SGIKAGSTSSESAAAYVWKASLGRHNLTFVSDSENEVQESNETNNQVSYLIDVTEPKAVMVNGAWETGNGIYTPTDFGQSKHPILVINGTQLEDTIITTQVNLSAQNAEAGLCGRMNTTGYGYCLSTAWGKEEKAVISYFSGHPYNPDHMAEKLIDIDHTKPVTIKMMLRGTLIKGKVFNTGQPEPEWQVHASDTRLKKGNTGYYAYIHTATFYGSELSLSTSEPEKEVNGTIATGHWERNGSMTIPVAMGASLHPILVLNATQITNGTATTQVILDSQNSEAGLCGRMNTAGFGYCASTAWGGEQKLVLSYFDSSYNPEYMAESPLSINHSRPVTIKLNFNGTLIKGKAFNTGQPEPEWQAETSDTRFTTGSAGYYSYRSSPWFYNTTITGS
ncbi:hypothetical protein HYU15_00525, partial [Candidatus Woesearchaeota archaeon]|nr:hypothetical protein [Candidatus Woesearchaeota archaeon]